MEISDALQIRQVQTLDLTFDNTSSVGVGTRSRRACPCPGEKREAEAAKIVTGDALRPLRIQ